jgi:hypothetical protein
VIWISPADLGSIDNGSESLFTIRAITPQPRDLAYRLRPGSNSLLPKGLRLLPSGNIAGTVSYDTFTLDTGTTTFDVTNRNLLSSTPTTFDLTYTFVVEVYSPTTQQVSYKVTGITVQDGGQGYAQDPTVTIAPPPGQGVAATVVTQFQSVIVPSNDPMGFTIPGSAGKIYVGSNGICKLSTPVWNADKKAFSYKASAPRLAPDGTSVNTGFYYASISYADAIALWNLTRPEDAATALVVSVRTGAGGSTAATANVSAKNGKIVIQVSGFEFPDPMLDISLNPAYNDLGKPSAESNMTVAASEQQMSTPKKSTTATSRGSVAKAKTITISCVKGKTTKKVTAVKPVCPAGFKKA